MLILPSKRLLQYYKNSVPQAPGIVDRNFKWMAKEASKQHIQSYGKHGGLLIDEMSIQDDLQVVKNGDEWSIVGNVHMGELNNQIDIIINKSPKVRMATHCLQYVFHGFTGFRWPVAYFGSDTACAYQIYNYFWDVVAKLNENGFIVDYVNMDGATTNRLFMNMLSNSGNLREENFIVSDIFQKDHKICLIQDVKHVIKKIRNSLLVSKSENKSKPGRYILMNSTPIVWEHWESAYKYNIQDGFPIHKNLTNDHIEVTPVSKMRNHLAADVLNTDMLYLMKCYQSTLENPESLASTVEILENSSIIVDFFLDKRPINNLQDPRLQKLKNVLLFFNKWEKEIEHCKLYSASKNLITFQTREDLNSSIQGFLSLCEQHVGNGNSINPGYINSDIIENNFVN
ncbi:Hypothetical predicted protein [Mytilus galloprovincialis]|uniref:Transposable element P transposase-like RNase H domain-containing protein n=1 Tax=Mytilus galloprovincialis TaxID=29158 RepID=A0A8B6DIJ3_MYTGA|nr:Hypothetical predicted protein [Mytilus galloprovincialis]